MLYQTTVNSLTIKACTFGDMVYYFRVKEDLTHLQAAKKVAEICDFLNTDFGCEYRKGKPTGQELYDAKYAPGN
tara:strand:+ start:234 stop:455 length:222 start_codon:yes stop_codon:yes gene_type:complete